MDDIKKAAYEYRQRFNSYSKDYPTYFAESGFIAGALWARSQGETLETEAYDYTHPGEPEVAVRLGSDFKVGDKVRIQVTKK